MKSFPLIESLGNGVRIHQAYELPKSAPVVFACDLEYVLAKAPLVKCYGVDGEWYPENALHSRREPTHTARLICVEAIAKDTAEDLVRDLADCNGKGIELLIPFIERACRLLESRGK